MYRRYKFKLQKLVCTAALCNYNVLLSLGDRGYSSKWNKWLHAHFRTYLSNFKCRPIFLAAHLSLTTGVRQVGFHVLFFYKFNYFY